MRRIIALFIIILVLFFACSNNSIEPVIEKDERLSQSSLTVEEDKNSPAIESTVVPITEVPMLIANIASASEEKTLTNQIISAWNDAELLEGFAPYSQLDLLDLYGIDLSTCISGAGFADAVSYVNEIVIVEADEAITKDVEILLENHLEAVKKQFLSYDANAYNLVEKAVLIRENGIVLMIVSPNAEAMQNIFWKITK